MAAMEERITRPATSFGDASRAAGSTDKPVRFARPTAQQISLCCEISAYAPDGDDLPLF